MGYLFYLYYTKLSIKTKNDSIIISFLNHAFSPFCIFEKRGIFYM